MNYEPRISDPRVYMRISTAMDWCLYNLNETKPKEWARVYLDRQLGHTHRPLGQWLRNKLLITQDTHYNMLTGKCKAYLLNAQGVKDICVLLGLPLPRRWTKFKKTRVLQHSRAKYHTELATGVFEYEHKSNRQFNPIQNLPTNVRTQLFVEHGYVYDYDIVSASMNLIHQLAQSARTPKRGKPTLNKPTPELDCYLDNPTEYRNTLANDIGIEPAMAKQIIQARLNGAPLRIGKKIYEDYLNNSRIHFYRLKTHKGFTRLTKEFTVLWDAIKRDQTYHLGRWSGKHKARVYFEQEQRVMRVIEQELTKNKCRYFLEHDGWRCDRFVVPYDLELAVRTKTGFVIQLKWTKTERV